MNNARQAEPSHRHPALTRAFDALSNRDHLRQALESASDETVTFQELYRLAATPTVRPNAKMARMLLQNPRLREDLKRLLQKRAVCHFPSVAAASSLGELTKRKEKGFVIEIKSSRVESSQVYILIHLEEHILRHPESITLIHPELGVIKQALPEALGGVVQLLADSDSPLVQAIRRIETEIFLH
ncbi:MAG: hypothetical protein HQL52_05535 [Magnetococcales bacterium]|nr:hypothetical protein [Magnetococcales bacterium]